MKDLFFPISKKVMFRNNRFVTTENILKCYSSHELLMEEKSYSKEQCVH